MYNWIFDSQIDRTEAKDGEVNKDDSSGASGVSAWHPPMRKP